MKAWTDGSRHWLKLERGEEAIATLRGYVQARQIPSGTLSGLGALDEATVSFYDVEKKEYRAYRHAGLIEVLALSGNVAWRGSEPIVHVHVAAAEEREGAFGGHLVSGIVSATLEVVLDAFSRRVERVPDPAIGLPLLGLPDWPPAGDPS